MKKIGELMIEAGFSKKASVGTQEAFIKHLIKASTGVSVATPSEKSEIQANPDKVKSLPTQPVQLSFDFAEAGTYVESSSKKVSTF